MTNQRDGTNYYDVLEVSPDAAQVDIHKAYQRAKATYSQDNPALYSMFSREEARELLRMIEEAFAVLGNQSLRRSYDESLVKGSANGGPALNTAGPALHPSPSTVSTGNPSPNPAQIASEHQALPDFNVQEPVAAAVTNDVSDSFKVKKKETAKASLAPGMGRTPLSTYKLDESFESELASQTEFTGALIQKIRLYKNISIDKMSEATRISRTYLMAVETNDYKALPAAVFVRGFIVQISRLLGLDETKVAASYMKAFKANSGK